MNFLPEQKFNTIFHISDIHIRNDQDRQKEFQQQFLKTFKIIKNHPKYDNTSLIVVTGDILDKGLLISGIAIELLHIFIQGLTNLAPTIIIPGNHDDKKDIGESRLDSLSAIFQTQTTKNLYYFRDSGIYTFGSNLVFGHTSVIDYKLIQSKDIKNIKNIKDIKDRIKIALFHGMLDGQTQNQNFLLRDCQFAISHFQGYQHVLLGDVHKYSEVAENMWYAGSLVQKSFAEDRNIHGGLLVWDLTTNKPPQFIHIPNDHAFITLRISQGKLIGEFISQDKGLGLTKIIDLNKNTLPKYISIKFKCDHLTSSEQIDKIVIELQKYTQIISRFQVFDNTNIKNNNKQNEPTQIPTLKQFLEIKYPTHILPLLELDNKYTKNNNNTHRETNGKWIPIKLEMNNIYNYKNNHSIDFQKLPQNEIISIHGKNGSGKSKILETLLLAIYGCPPKDLTHIITQGQKKGNTSITILLNNNIFQINRSYNKNGKSIPAPIITKNDINISGTSKIDNQNFINQLLGTKEDLEDTHISKQGRHESFLYKREKEQLALLSKLFQTHTFNDKQINCKQDLTINKKLLKNKNQQLKQFIDEFIQPSILQQEITTLQQQLNDLPINLLKKHQQQNYKRIIESKHLKQQIIDIQIGKQRELDKLPIETKYYCIDKLNLDLIQFKQQLTQLLTQIHPLSNDLLNNIQILQDKQLHINNKLKKKNNKLQTLIQNIQQINIIDTHITINKQYWTYENLIDYPNFNNISKNEQLEDLIEKRKLLIFPDNINYLYQQSQKLIEIQNEMDRCKENINNDPYSYNDNCTQCINNKKHNHIIYLETKIQSLTKQYREIQDTIKYDTIKYDNKIEKMYNNYKQSITLDEHIRLHRLFIEYNQHKQFNIENNKLQSILEQQKQYKQQLEIYNTKKIQLETNIIQLQTDSKQIEYQLNQLQKEIQYQKSNEIKKLQSNKLEKQIEILQKQINDKKNYDNIILQVKIFDEKLFLLQQQLDNLDIIPEKQLETQIKDTETQFNQLQQSIWSKQQFLIKMIELEKQNETLNIEIKQLETDIKLLEIYKEITNEYPLYANQKGIQHLEDKINFSLHNMTSNFKLKILYCETDTKSNLQFIKLDRKTKHNINIVDCSGFEKFIIAICLRIALSNLSSVNSINIMIIDEGFGVFDKENIKQLPNMLEPLKQIYQQIFIITHIDSLQSELQYKIKIEPGPKIVLLGN